VAGHGEDTLPVVAPLAKDWVVGDHDVPLTASVMSSFEGIIEIKIAERNNITIVVLSALSTIPIHPVATKMAWNVSLYHAFMVALLD